VEAFLCLDAARLRRSGTHGTGLRAGVEASCGR
jgi:hypothetical protein